VRHRERFAANGNADASTHAMRWLLAIAAAGALIGWQMVRHGRVSSHARTLQRDLHRWEGEGGQVLD
jgi:hypothetical protein